MSDTINIKIRSQFDAAGTSQARKEIEGLVAAIKGAASGKAPDPGYGQVAAQARTASQAVAGLSKADQQAARAAEQLAQAQNRTAQSAAQAAAAQSRAEKAALQLAQAQQRANQAAQSGGGYFDKMGASIQSSIMGIVGPAAIATTAIKGIELAVNAAQTGAQLQGIEQSFRALAKTGGQTADTLLAKMRAAAQGTISDAKLMESANTGLLLTNGKMAAELPRLIEIARASARATGQEVSFVFDSLTRGIARGSPMIIDNAGITLNASQAFNDYAASIGKSADQLTKAEQQQATLNAVVAAGNDIIAKTGATVAGNAELYAQANTQIENAKNRASELAADGLAPVVSGFGALAGAITGTDSTLTDAIGTLFTSQEVLVANARAQLEASAAAQQLAASEGTRAAATNETIIAQQASAAQTMLDTQAKEQSTAQSELLAAQIQMVGDAYLALNPNIDASGIAQAVAAGKIDAAVGVYLQQVIAIQKTKNELAALQAQAGMAGGAVEGRSERDTPADRAAAAAAGAQAQAQRKAAADAARSAQVLATGTTAAKRAELQKQYNDAVAAHGRESAEAINAQTKLLQAQTTGGAGRTRTAATTGQRLATIEQNTGQKLADIDKATQQKLAAIDKKAADDRIAAAKRLNQAMQANAAQRRADNEADDLDAVGITDPKEAARLNDRERAQAASREREKAAAAEAREAIAAGDAETAEKVYAAREEAISKQQALDEKYYERQRELAGDPAAQEALKTQYDEATRAINEATQLQIDFAHAAADEKAAAAQAEKDAVIAAADEQKNAVIGKAQESAAGIKNATASARASAVADLQAIGSAVNAIPSNKTVTVSVKSSGSADGGSAGAQGRSDGAYAGGGDFVTNGPTTITVGDNPGGREFVSVVPLSGTGTTRPVPGGVAMAGGGTVDAGDGYTTPVAGQGSGSKAKKKGKGSSKGGSSNAAADIKDKIEEQKNLIQLLSDMLALRADMAREVESGTPFNVGFARALAKRAGEFAAFVRAALPTATKDEAEGYKRTADNSRDGIAVLSDLIQLRKDMSDYKDVNPFDVAFVERLAAVGKRIVQIVQGQLVPTTQAEVDRMQRWADLNGAVVGLIKDVAGLNAQMFADYVPPSDAQLNAIAKDANRIALRMVAIARTYDTKGLDAAKQFVDAVGGTFSAFKDGLLFFQALNSGDFVLNPGNLAKFERSTAQTMAVAARLGAMARKIPSQDLAALQLTTQALAGQAEALIKLAAVPFADLPAAARALQLQSNTLLGGARGAGGGSVVFNIYQQPGQDARQLASEALRLFKQEIGKRR